MLFQLQCAMCRRTESDCRSKKLRCDEHSRSQPAPLLSQPKERRDHQMLCRDRRCQSAMAMALLTVCTSSKDWSSASSCRMKHLRENLPHNLAACCGSSLPGRIRFIRECTHFPLREREAHSFAITTTADAFEDRQRQNEIIACSVFRRNGVGRVSSVSKSVVADSREGEVSAAMAVAEPFFKIPGTDAEVEEDLDRMTQNVREVQLETLRKILERNGNVEYLQRQGLNQRTDETSFKACVPVISIADIQDDVDRIADGDTAPILCADPVTSFSVSSGTSGGKSKMIPRTANTMAQVTKAGKIGSVFRRRAYPRRLDSEKPQLMAFAYAGRQFETKSGLKAGTGTTVFYRSEAFKSNAKNMPFAMTSPTDVVLACNVPQQMYCHLLCGLYRSRDVEQTGAIFAYMIVEPFRLLERVWRDICKDIREGTVDEFVSDPALRSSVQEILSPDPELADFIERECAKGWSGIIERLFPNLLFIMSNFTGAMLPYIAPMRKYAGAVPLVNGDYGSSESWIGVNLDPRAPVESGSYTIIPDFAYFEFIPVNRDPAGSECVKDNEIVGLADVKVGQEYEILLTTVAGLYRYRQEDILRVTGYYNSSPQVAFVCRKGVVLSVNTDKTDEEELQLVVEKASRNLKEANMELVEFSSHADHDSQPGHYVIFWELQSHENLDMSVFEECCKILDRSFNDPYMRGRAAGTIGPLELVIVKSGAFARLMDQFVNEKGVGASQYKTPRCVTNPASLKLLRDETILTSLSPEFPPELQAAWRPSSHIVG